MIENFKGFVPSTVCLACDGCCRFKEADSPWRPNITKEEITSMGKPDLLSTIYSKKNVEHNGHLKTAPCTKDGHHFCSFFVPATNTCSVYEFRPFECQLYPFVLTKKNGKAVLVAHHHCPYIKEKRNASEFEEYVSYLKEFFRQKDTIDFIRRNPSLIGEYKDYQNEFEYLFEVC